MDRFARAAGGDPLRLEIKKAIDAASAYAAVVSTDAPQSKWVGKELRHALLVREQRGKDLFPVIPLSLDGHGVYDRRVGLGGLCFEEPQDIGQLEKRRNATVFTDALGPLLRDHGIPLVFLEVCQTAQAEQASEAIASELLKIGVASVVAMSHSVLVETARRFVAAFYRALAAGKRVDDAMLAGQRGLKDDTFRGRIFGAFVPVLFQEKDDPQLFKTAPAKQTVEDFQKQLAARLGELPKEPEMRCGSAMSPGRHAR